MVPALSSAPDSSLDASSEKAPRSTRGVELELDSRRELRVALPPEVHRKLRSLKILRGMNIGDCVTQALEQYFDERPGLQRLVLVTPDAHQDDDGDE